MAITAILITHNSAASIARALGGVFNSSSVSSVIVVDNASTDATVDIIRTEFPATQLIINRENCGFGRAANQALECVSTDFTLLINPDVTIENDSIHTLLETCYQHPDTAIVAPLLQDAATIKDITFQLPFMRSKNLPHAHATDMPTLFRSPFISGAAALWRMAHMREVGFFDPAFFLFYEDDDLCYRITRAGHTMLICAAAPAQHQSGTSCVLTEALKSLKLRSSVWSSLYIRRKYQGWLIGYLYAVITALRGLLKICFYKRIDPLKEQQYQAARKENEQHVAQKMLQYELQHSAAIKQHQQEANGALNACRERAELSLRALEEEQRHASDYAEAAAQHETQLVEKIRSGSLTEEAIRDHEKAWAEKATELEKRYHEETVEQQQKWTEKTHALEVDHAAEMNALEEEWKQKTVLLEQTWRLKSEALKQEWEAIETTYHTHIALVEERKALRATLRAALYFLRHPTYCAMAE